MKNPILIVINCLVFFSSCSFRQDIIEKNVFEQIGDSCIYAISKLIEDELKEYLIPPAPDEILIDLLVDTLNENVSLKRYDTLGFPIRFTVCKFNSKIDTSSVREYYEAFYHQNSIRIKYIYENIFIDDTLIVPTLNMIKEAFETQDSIADKFHVDQLSNLTKKHFLNNLEKLTWNIEETKENSKIINDLKPTRIQFYRIIFNKNYTQGLLFNDFEIWGFLKVSSYFEIERKKSSWIIKDFAGYSIKRNPKRWIQE